MKNVYFKKGTVLFMVLLIMLLCVIPSSNGFKQDLKPLFLNDGNTLYVGGIGPNNYTRIQDAIDNASVGDTVFVFDDSSPYYECLFLNKSLSLVGEDRNTTVIDAEHKGSPVLINADGCLVSGFTIQNCKGLPEHDSYSCVMIYGCDNVVVRDNRLTIGDFVTVAGIATIFLHHGSSNCTIQGNFIFDEDQDPGTIGIALGDGSSYNVISGNDISGYCNGIRFDWYTNCDYNVISGNYIHDVFFGICITGCYYNQILNNMVEYCESEGIRLDNAQHTTISGNIIQYNGDGSEFDCGIKLLADDCRYNTVSGNVVSNNNPTGIYVNYAFGNVIKENNFIDNYGSGGEPKKWWGNAYFVIPLRIKSLIGANSWRRNYWSDYSGSGVKLINGDIFIFIIYINWYQIEWLPAKEPYNI